MRAYMPQKHRWLVNDVRGLPSALKARQFVEAPPSSLSAMTSAALKAAWASGLERLREFRTGHLRLASLYIVQQAQRNVDRYQGEKAPSHEPAGSASATDGAGLKGTGGTELVPFLKQARDETV